MKKGIHGGDIYRNRVDMDFSVNINPLGVPKEVAEALHKAVDDCDKYPDVEAEQLKHAVSNMLQVPERFLLFGNGASELFMAIIHGLRPKKVVIPVPSFYGYEYAAEAFGAEVFYYETDREKDFCLTEDVFSVLTPDVDLLFLANPNNPTGALLSRGFLETLLRHCRENDIIVVLDECFIEFCGGENSILQQQEQFSNLILVRAFTKIFAIPGVRLGYLVCRDLKLQKQISRQLPEWNLSVFAQAAGCACATQAGFIRETVEYVKKERAFLENGLKQLGLLVYPGKANFLLVQSREPLYERLQEQGILIRDCGNFRGLTEGTYRIAVKSRKENEALLKAMGEWMWRE